MYLNELADQLLEEEGSSAAVLALKPNVPLGNLRNHGFKAVLMAALPYPASGPEDLSHPGDPHLRLAPFARANYYREALARMKEVVRRLRRIGNWSKGDFRIFINSSLPEKALALQAGLGFQGRNGLIITPGAGSLVVLSGLALPFVPEGAFAPLPRYPAMDCGSCRRCIDACPTGALRPEGGLVLSRCLQALSTRPFPMRYWDAWETRFYGCQTCQEVCPHNQNPRRGIQTEEGFLGPSLSLKYLLSNGEDLKNRLKGSVLDRRWIRGENLLRNALIAAGNHPHVRAVENEVKPYLKQQNPEIKAAAWRAWKRMG